MARRLVGILKRRLGAAFDPAGARIAVFAALLHDLGHGPFSHTFEGVMTSRGMKKKHEKWSQEIILGDTAVNKTLRIAEVAFDQGLIDKIADLLAAKEPRNIYSSIVSSQLDADRIDYLMRDRYMTGAQTGSFDLSWLLSSIDVQNIVASMDDAKGLEQIESFVVSEKGLQATESYLLGRYHLYVQVYMHKTTRAAEKMLAAALKRLGNLIDEGKADDAGISKNNFVRAFFERNGDSLANYLALDDSIVWSSLASFCSCDDKVLSELSARLLKRDLFKCIDFSSDSYSEQSVMRLRHKLNGLDAAGEITYDLDTLVDSAKVSAYGIHGFDDAGALHKVLVRRHKDDNNPQDIATQSKMLGALGAKRLFRVYVANDDTREKVNAAWKECKDA